MDTNGKKRTKNVSMYQSKPIQFVLIELILSYHVYTSVSNYRTIVFTVRVKFTASLGGIYRTEKKIIFAAKLILNSGLACSPNNSPLK